LKPNLCAVCVVTCLRATSCASDFETMVVLEGGGEVRTGEADVIVGVFAEDGSQSVVRSHIETDGGKAWDDAVHGNELSFAGIYDANAQACPSKLQQLIAVAHDALWSSI
jgi:hypothetical protein